METFIRFDQGIAICHIEIILTPSLIFLIDGRSDWYQFFCQIRKFNNSDKIIETCYE